jgi:anti-sigma B factor antagonist
MTADEIQALIENTVPPPTEEQVQAFESEIGTSLPQDYRAFLAHCNGGWADMKIQHDAVYIMSINGLRKGHEYSLSYCRRFIGNRIPKSLIWIMNDPGGNLICLGVTGRDRGHVYFWDHEGEPDEDSWDGEVESAGNIELIPGSFAEFLAGLRKSEFVELETEQPPRHESASATGDVGAPAQSAATAEPRERLRVEVRHGVTLVHFVDRSFIHDQECDELSEQLETLLADGGQKQFLLNLDSVQYLTSFALETLCDFVTRVEAARGTTKLCCVSPDLKELFRLTRVDQLFDIYDDEHDALATY